MGCSNSTPVHPSIYNELIKRREVANGEIKEKVPVDDIKANQMRGDYSQFQLAKHNREKHHKERQLKLFMAADEMSGKVMEDREMLSLGTRSRGTSRNTSRATSPTGNKRGHQADNMTPMTPVAEDKLSRGASLRSMENGTLQPEATPKKKHKTHKHSKTKGKTKKHKKGKKSKKGKSSKGKDHSDKEELDSGLEEEDEDDAEHFDEDSDKENDSRHTSVKNAGNSRSEKVQRKDSVVTDAKIGEQVTVLPLVESVNSAQSETPLMTNRSVRDIKIQSASKDSGIAENSSADSPKVQNAAGENDINPEERSDSRI